MQLLKDIGIRFVLWWVLGAFCVVWGAVTLYTLPTLTTLSHNANESEISLENINDMMRATDQYFRVATHLSRVVENRQNSRAVNTSDPDLIAAHQAMNNLQQQLSTFKVMSHPGISEETVQQVINDLSNLIDLGVAPQYDAVANNQLDQYHQRLQQVIPDLSLKFADSAEKLVAQATAQFKIAKNQVVDLSHISRISILCAYGFMLVMIFLTDRYLVMALMRPLRALRDQFLIIAEGKLDQQQEDFGKNCVGRLIPLLRDMQNNLLKTVLIIRHCSDNIYQGTSEIASGNGHLASRTEQQASALEQTAASMEQLTATVRQNAENAIHANQLADNASATAHRGGEIVASVVSTMENISGSAHKISEITNVINSIAFQTNILALNAAVEAARAGEQGRGFAVVASEVRNLAQRCAQAAKEIENLVQESVSRVDSGAKLVESAGITMGEIVHSITQVNDIISEIASASEEQSKGISQVAQAISEMDSVVQQNSTLVQEANHAAISLEEQAQELNQAVSLFSVGINNNPIQTHTSPSSMIKNQPSKPVSASIKEGWETF